MPPPAHGQEYHIQAPPQRVIVELEEDEPAAAAASATPAAQPALAQSAGLGQPLGQMGGMVAANGMMAAPGGLVAIPTVRGRRRLALGIDFINIPIPIPRLFEQELPPETTVSYMQVPPQFSAPMGGGVVQTGMVNPMAFQAAGVQSAHFVGVPPGLQAGANSTQLSAQQIATLAAALENNKAAQANSSASSQANALTQLEEKERQLNAKAKQLDEACQKMEALLDKQAGP